MHCCKGLPTALTQRASFVHVAEPDAYEGFARNVCAAHSLEQWSRHRLALNDPGSRKSGIAARALAPLPGASHETAGRAVSSAGLHARPTLDTRRRRNANAIPWSRYARLGRTIRCVARCSNEPVRLVATPPRGGVPGRSLCEHELGRYPAGGALHHVHRRSSVTSPRHAVCCQQRSF